jgi:hypothetical protein
VTPVRLHDRGSLGLESKREEPMKTRFALFVTFALLFLSVNLPASAARDLTGLHAPATGARTPALPLCYASGTRVAGGARVVNAGSDGDDTQVDLGSDDPDTFLQYGRAGNDTQ